MADFNGKIYRDSETNLYTANVTIEGLTLAQANMVLVHASLLVETMNEQVPEDMVKITLRACTGAFEQKVMGIKVLRKASGIGLKEAKDAVEQVMDGTAFTFTAQREVFEEYIPDLSLMFRWVYA